MSNKPFRVLSLDGGGMRGLFVAEFLSFLLKEKGKRLNKDLTDIGKAFDLIAGTSTGGLIACTLAAGCNIDAVKNIYKQHGESIFPAPKPFNWKIIMWALRHLKKPAGSPEALRKQLTELLGEKTLQEVYKERNIALCITAVDYENCRPKVFKTPHAEGLTIDREYKLVDVCMSTSAAPIYFNPHTFKSDSQMLTYLDGGLWANNPSLVALLEALDLAPDREIEILSIGTCPPNNAGIKDKKDMGLLQWRFGIDALMLTLDAQSMGHYNMTKRVITLINEQRKNKIKFTRWPISDFCSKDMHYMQLDSASEKACHAMSRMAKEEAEKVINRSADIDINGIFGDME